MIRWLILSINALVSIQALAATRLNPNINRDLPLFLEDARPIGAGSLQLQTVTRYERINDGTSQYFLLPQVQYGFSSLGFVEAATNIILGSEPKSGSGDLTIGGFHSLLPYPADSDSKPRFKLAFYTQIELPTGWQSSGVENESALFTTESLDGLEKNEVHLNLYWLYASRPGESVLRNRYRVIAGYNNDINEKWMFLADYVREQGPEWNQFSNLLEAGMIYSSSTHQTFAIGLGGGFGGVSQTFRTTLAYQYAFGGD